MTAGESIAVGEALLTSDLMRLAQFPDDDHPCSLAIALGLRSTAAADAIVFVSPAEADSLIRRAVATDVVRRHGERLDIAYLEHTLRPICELAEDMAPWSRLQRVLSALRSPDEHA